MALEGGKSTGKNAPGFEWVPPLGEDAPADPPIDQPLSAARREAIFHSLSVASRHAPEVPVTIQKTYSPLATTTVTVNSMRSDIALFNAFRRCCMVRLSLLHRPGVGWESMQSSASGVLGVLHAVSGA